MATDTLSTLTPSTLTPSILTPSILERVELFEDRAAITRTVTLAHDATLVIGPLTPLLQPAGLSVEAQDTDTLVEEVSLRRERVLQADADDDVLSTLRSEVEAQEAALRHATEDVADKTARRDQAHARLQRAQDWTPRAYIEGDPSEWARALVTLAEQAVQAELLLTDATAAAAAIEEAVRVLRRRLYDARAGQSVLRTFVTLRVRGASGAVLRLRYTVPCAVWRPVHRARRTEDRVFWTLSAMVWNHTGEDWPHASIVCSTARPGERADPPTLTDDRVRASKRGKEVVVEEREQAVNLAREGTARPVDDVPGVDDGGEARTFTAAAPVDIPSTGRPVLVPLDAWDSEATVVWRAAPELSEALVRVSRQTNAGSRPLLAGPVSLYGEHGAIGQTEVGLVPSGEPFDLGWGSHDDVRITRRLDVERSEGRLTGRTSHAVRVILRAMNTGKHPVVATIRERIPVSELAGVTVSHPTAQPVLKDGPDDDGFCTWSLTLQPQTAHDLTLSYAIDAASHVTLPF